MSLKLSTSLGCITTLLGLVFMFLVGISMGWLVKNFVEFILYFVELMK